MNKEDILAKYPIHHRAWKSMVGNNHATQVCEEWRGWYGFLRFIEDMPQPHSEHVKLKRVDEAYPFDKDNCYWATPASLSRRKVQPHNSSKAVSVSELRTQALIKKYPSKEDKEQALGDLLNKSLDSMLSYDEAADMEALAALLMEEEQHENTLS